MAFDFKKEYKEFYLPKQKPEIVTVPPAQYIAVRGKGDPNIEGGEYKAAVGALYAVAYTIKMSKMGEHAIEGYFDFVVPPLEGFWWQRGVCGFDPMRKDAFEWLSIIRMPDFVVKEEFEWACAEATRKKGIDVSSVELLTIDEGECVQIMHIGPYDLEAETVSIMDAFIEERGYENDMSDIPAGRHHHEIYLSDPRRVDPSKWKTVIRHPIRKKP